MMSTNVYTGLNTFNFIREHFLQICIRKVVVRLQKVLEVISTSVDTGLDAFNLIRKHFLQICLMLLLLMYAVIAVSKSLSALGRSRYTADFAAPHR
jgi:hypothetical protein